MWIVGYRIEAIELVYQRIDDLAKQAHDERKALVRHAMQSLGRQLRRQIEQRRRPC